MGQAMKIAVPAERSSEETRAAISPDAVKTYIKRGCTVAVEMGAGRGAFISDEAYRAAGATIADTAETAVTDADIVLTVRRPPQALVDVLKPGSVVVGLLDPHGDKEGMQALSRAGVTAFAVELMPRISRAQSMDVLSSQANLAGYKAVIEAAHLFTRAFPMMMTAGGTIPPTRVFVMGAGVAGLQAIATARRLGAVVSATDVRAEVGEQVQSLGGKFIFIEGLAGAGAGGYARELSAEEQKQQGALVASHIKTQDIVITTALIPGRPAPALVTPEMVESMRPGSVIVDLAVERGGNCPLSRPGEVVEHNGVSILGATNLAAQLPGNATQLYARNLQNFLEPLINDGALSIDWNDEIIAGCGLMRSGEIVHPVIKS